MNKPQFFIIGAPRCGTTSLYTYLREHKEIFLPHVKEPFFWCFDFPRMQTVFSEAEYLRLFDGAGPEKTLCGEASTIYLYSHEAPRRIHEFDKAARIVVLVRNPIDLVRSWHSWLYSCFDEDEHDFERAWNLNAERRAGRRIPKRCRFPMLLDYARIGKLASAIARWREIFPEEQIKCLFLEDLGRSPAAAYRETLNFLGIEDDGRSEFPHLNENREQRIRWLSLLQERKPRWVARTTAQLKHIVPKKLYELCRFDVRRVQRTMLSAEMHARLCDEFAADIRDLGRMLNRDLSAWLGVPRGEVSKPATT